MTEVPSLLQQMLDGVSDAVIALSSRNEIIAQNARARTLLVPLPDALEWLTGLSDGTRETLMGEDGGRTPIAASVRVAEAPDGQVRIITLRDRSAEEALHTLETRFNAFLDHAPLGMYLLDEDARFVIANTQMLGVFDNVDSLVGRNVVDLVEPETTELTRAWHRSILDSQEIERGELERPRDPFRWTYTVRFPVTIEGQPRFVGGFILDITERKQAEAELARSLAALQQTEKMRALGSLLAGVSHELNNPLSALIGQATMLEEDVAGLPFAERAGRIKAAADRCVRIVQIFLAMARQRPPRRVAMNMGEAVRSALELLAFTMRASRVEVDMRLPDDLPAIQGDPDQLHQVLINLLINASQALDGHDGERRITITGRRLGTFIEIKVADNGPGIPAEIADRIFEPFFTTKAPQAGTGIGLAFSVGVVEGHDGELSSVPTETGACFCLRLPIGTPAADAVEAAPAPVYKGGTVIVVDDDSDVGETVAEMLMRSKFDVKIFNDGAAALDEITTGEPAAIISDLRMPGIDGPELLARIRKDRPDLASRIGFMTGDVLAEASARFVAECGRPVIEKPVSQYALIALVASLAVGGG